MTRGNHEVLMARYVLGSAKSWELPEIADAFINDGLGTPAIAELATMRNPTMAEAGPLFERVLQERGIQIPSREEAVWMLLRHYLQGIAAGTTMPQEGLGLVMSQTFYPGKLYETSRELVGDSHDLAHLIGAWYEYDELYKSEDVMNLNAEVVKLAQDWVRHHGSGQIS